MFAFAVWARSLAEEVEVVDGSQGHDGACWVPVGVHDLLVEVDLVRVEVVARPRLLRTYFFNIFLFGEGEKRGEGGEGEGGEGGGERRR